MSKSRVPEMPDADRSLIQFLDAIDRRQLTMSQLEDIAPSATNAELAAAINAILASHRTK